MLFMYVDNNIEYWIESDGEINEDVNIGEISRIPSHWMRKFVF